jgi:hypothetical protein
MIHLLAYHHQQARERQKQTRGIGDFCSSLMHRVEESHIATEGEHMGDVLVGAQQLLLKGMDLLKDIWTEEIVLLVVRSSEGDVVWVRTSDFLGKRNRSGNELVVFGEVGQVIGFYAYLLLGEEEGADQGCKENDCQRPGPNGTKTECMHQTGDGAMGEGSQIFLLGSWEYGEESWDIEHREQGTEEYSQRYRNTEFLESIELTYQE